MGRQDQEIPTNIACLAPASDGSSTSGEPWAVWPGIPDLVLEMHFCFLRAAFLDETAHRIVLHKAISQEQQASIIPDLY